jgi:hypothetical protein
MLWVGRHVVLQEIHPRRSRRSGRNRLEPAEYRCSGVVAVRVQAIQDAAIGERSRDDQAFLMQLRERTADLGHGLEQAFLHQPPMNDTFDGVFGGRVAEQVLKNLSGEIGGWRGESRFQAVRMSLGSNPHAKQQQGLWRTVRVVA